MIAHYSVYSKIYKPCYIAVMIAFCWTLSYGMQLPTFFGIWGETFSKTRNKISLSFIWVSKQSLMTIEHERSCKTCLSACYRCIKHCVNQRLAPGKNWTLLCFEFLSSFAFIFQDYLHRISGSIICNLSCDFRQIRSGSKTGDMLNCAG